MQPSEDHSLLGQKLGPKGRQARDRLLVAARELMMSQPMTAPTLTAVCAVANVSLTAVHRYYADAGALFVSAMRPMLAEMTPVIRLLEEPWKPGAEYGLALQSVAQHFDYWHDRRGALFLRNSFAEGGDARFIALRMEWAAPLYRALAEKLAAAHGRLAGEADMAVAGVVLSGMERTTTLTLQHAAAHGDAGGAVMSRQAEKQQAAVAQIITSLLRREYLEGLG